MAVAILPLALLVGAATDLRRVETERARVQDASDAAVLAASRAYWITRGQSDARLVAARDAAGRTLFGNLTEGRGSGAGDTPPGLSAFDWELGEPQNGQMVLSIRSRVPLAFGGLFRMEDFGFGTRSAATTGAMKNLEVALVLDNTGSMGRLGKIGVLRTATVGLVEQLEQASALNPDRENALRVALVPFSMTVRLDQPETYQRLPWMTGSPTHGSYDGLFTEDRFAIHDRAGGWQGCVEARPSSGGHDIDEGVGGGDARYVPYTHPGGDPNQGCGLLPIQRLTSDTAAVKSAAERMQATGNTNIPMGLIWGWHAIAPSGVGPFGAGAAYGRDDTVKAIVLMTDGLNEINGGGGPNGGPYSGIGYPSQGRIAGLDAGTSNAGRSKALDARLVELCRAVKAKEVTVYAVRLLEGPMDVLSGCASDPSKYFNVTRVEDLDAVFGQIAGDILALRLSE